MLPSVGKVVIFVVTECVCAGMYVVDMLIMMHIGIRCLRTPWSLESLLAPTGPKSNNGATAN